MRNKFVLISLLFLSSCSTYKSTWDCPIQDGIGCGTIEYADEMARKQIKLNKINGENQNILYNLDLLGGNA